MRKMLPFLVCLMLMLTAWAGMAHAVELRGVETSQADMAAHVAGDGDEVPADAEKGYPHHHASCHEHNVNTPPLSDIALVDAYHGSMPSVSNSPILVGYLPDPALRPPQA